MHQLDDCKGSLKCYQRSSRGPEPPGCKGETEGSSDYCYDPDDDEHVEEGGNDGGGGDSFRLEMYWREDFFWQEVSRTRHVVIVLNFDLVTKLTFAPSNFSTTKQETKKREWYVFVAHLFCEFCYCRFLSSFARYCYCLKVHAVPGWGRE